MALALRARLKLLHAYMARNPIRYRGVDRYLGCELLGGLTRLFLLGILTPYPVPGY